MHNQPTLRGRNDEYHQTEYTPAHFGMGTACIRQQSPHDGRRGVPQKIEAELHYTVDSPGVQKMRERIEAEYQQRMAAEQEGAANGDA